MKFSTLTRSNILANSPDLFASGKVWPGEHHFYCPREQMNLFWSGAILDMSEFQRRTYALTISC